MSTDAHQGSRQIVGSVAVPDDGHVLLELGHVAAVEARQEIEAMSGRSVFVRLRVKVRKNWRNDPDALKLFGYKIPQEK